MKKYSFLAVPLALTLAFGLPTSEVQATTSQEVVQIITSLRIMDGDKDGNMRLTDTLSRAEMVAMICNLLVEKNTWVQPTTSPYPDVPRTHWASPFVAYGVQQGFVTGYSDGTFRPKNQVTLGEVSVMIPMILGYSNGDFSSYSMDGRVSWMATEGLLENVTAKSNTDLLTRQDTMYIFYNALTTPMKSGGTLFQTMGYTLTNQGEIDRIALIEALMEGPSLVRKNWETELPFSLEEVTSVTIDGVSATAKVEDIKENNLVYWVESTKSLWVYQKEVTGMIESIGDGTVTLGGITYTVDTETARYALSNLGEYRKGDMVTGIFGKEGGIAQFITPELGTGVMVGLVTDVTTTWQTDDIGGTYEIPAVTLMATDGTSYTFPLSETISTPEGAIMEVTVGKDGSMVLVKNPTSETLSGYVNADATMLGKTPIAKDVEILDIFETTAMDLFPSRLAGLTIDKTDVAYFRLNQQGEIDRLILKDVTGEMHTYALLDKITDNGSGMNWNVQYDLVVSGVGEQKLQSTTRYANIAKGAVTIKGELSDMDSISNLRSSTITRLDSGSAIMGGQSHILAQELVVWEKKGNDYYASTVNRLMEGDFYSMTGYFVSNSDRYVRIILAVHH